jgi:hypothetical protein
MRVVVEAKGKEHSYPHATDVVRLSIDSNWWCGERHHVEIKVGALIRHQHQGCLEICSSATFGTFLLNDVNRTTLHMLRCMGGCPCTVRCSIGNNGGVSALYRWACFVNDNKVIAVVAERKLQA